jgi:hypothetical protein
MFAAQLLEPVGQLSRCKILQLLREAFTAIMRETRRQAALYESVGSTGMLRFGGKTLKFLEESLECAICCRSAYCWEP